MGSARRAEPPLQRDLSDLGGTAKRPWREKQSNRPPQGTSYAPPRSCLRHCACTSLKCGSHIQLRIVRAIDAAHLTCSDGTPIPILIRGELRRMSH